MQATAQEILTMLRNHPDWRIMFDPDSAIVFSTRGLTLPYRPGDPIPVNMGIFSWAESRGRGVV